MKTFKTAIINGFLTDAGSQEKAFVRLFPAIEFRLLMLY